MRSEAHTALIIPWFYIKDLEMRYEIIIINGQMRNKPFLIVIYGSSLVKAAMNAVHVCKLRNGLNKMPQFLLFSMAKGGTKTIVHLSIAEESLF
jgi:hypothetical protein